MAIPLSLVARLEEIPKSSLESLGMRQVVQYRGEILPLLDVSHELKSMCPGGTSSGEKTATAPETSDETIPVVVCADANQRVGRGPVDVDGNHHRTMVILRQPLGELSGGCGFTGTLKSYHHDDGRRL